MMRHRQRGAALILLLVVLALGGTWYLISRIHERSADFTARNRQHNAAVLAEAKRALIGYVAHQAAVSGENNPGAFLCPEAPGNIGGENHGNVFIRYLLGIHQYHGFGLIGVRHAAGKNDRAQQKAQSAENDPPFSAPPYLDIVAQFKIKLETRVRE